MKVSRPRRAPPFALSGTVLAALICRPVWADGPAVEFALVPSHHVQAGGPAYRFRISRYEIRNDQFVAFLNDAIAHPGDERGAFVFVHSTTGDVYINISATGQIGSTVGNRTIKMFSPSVAGQVRFANGAYVVATAPNDYSPHPVAGVSWYGAVKFCNWLTVARGLPANTRAYSEAPSSNPTGWHPATITASNWAIRDLTPAEREALLDRLGFRLPMDGQSNGADAFNEWFKAASGRQTAGDVPSFDALYGFGTIDITALDANFDGSGDAFEPGTTPVGYFDGVNLLSDGVTATLDTRNAYGLYDMSGNVWEWVQDQSGGDPTRRRNRGGSWRSTPESLRLELSATRPASTTADSTGFRVVQRVLDDLVLTPVANFSAAGVWGGPYDPPGASHIVYAAENVIEDAVPFSITTDREWVKADPVAAFIPVRDAVDVEVRIDPNCEDQLLVGPNVAEVTFRDVADNAVATRIIHVTVREPLSVAPDGAFAASVTLGSTAIAPSRIYRIESSSDRSVSWSGSWTETSLPPSGLPWLLINGTHSAVGVLEPHSAGSLTLAIDMAAASALSPGMYTAQVVVTDDCTGSTFIRGVMLTVDAPLRIEPTAPRESIGVAGGPFVPETHAFTLTNITGTPRTWQVWLCEEAPLSINCTAPAVPWISLQTHGGLIAPDESTVIIAAFSSAAATLSPGEYSLTIRFEIDGGSFFVDRRITLRVTSLRIEPESDAEFRGPLAGPFTPGSARYTLFNGANSELAWYAKIAIDELSASPTSSTWLKVEPDSGVILDNGDSEEAVVVLTDEAFVLAPGEYMATVRFLSGETEATRGVTLFVGTEGFAVPMAVVRGDHLQLGGPTHTFRIGRFEVTNAEYARFLNDAWRNRSDARGAYLYHDTDSGDVYINSSEIASAGTEAPSESISTPIYRASAGRIRFQGDGNSPYVVMEEFEHHPVSGVSWYGAAKFSNWLTLAQGMSEEAQAYVEGYSAAQWHAASPDPATLVDLAGFRLPMDGNAQGAATWNEWYKAASRRGVNASGQPLFGALYGFGRNTLTPGSANYLNNGDSATHGTTPVGFFDGANAPFIGGTTANTSNSYNLYDFCGNVAEWVHERTSAGNSLVSATRGGHFNLGVGAVELRTHVRDPLPAESTLSFVGFRVVQSLTPVPLRVIELGNSLNLSGPYGGPFEPDALAFELRHDGLYTLDDMSITVDKSWLVTQGVPPSQIPPVSAMVLRLAPSTSASTLAIGNHIAKLEISDHIAETRESRAVTLDVREPLILSGPDRIEFEGRYCAPLDGRLTIFTISNESSLAMPWQVSADRPWITVTQLAGQGLSGTLPGRVGNALARLDILVRVNQAANDLPPGEHLARTAVRNPITGRTIFRDVVLKVLSPVEIEPESELVFGGPATGPFAPVGSTEFSLAMCQACDTSCGLDYDVASLDDWLAIAPEAALRGAVPPASSPVAFVPSIAEAALRLGPGEYEGSIEVRLIHPAHGPLPGPIRKPVRLTVRDAIVVDGDFGPWDLGCELSEVAPPFREVTLANADSANAIGVEITTDTPWLHPDIASIYLIPGQAVAIRLSISQSPPPTAGTHTVKVTFRNVASGFVHERMLTVSISGNFCVTPLSDLNATGPFGGRIEPFFEIFHLRNGSDKGGPWEWAASADQKWIRLSPLNGSAGAGEPSNSEIGGMLQDGQVARVVVMIDDTALPIPGVNERESRAEGVVRFEDRTHGLLSTRRIRVTRVRPRLTLATRLVPADDAQPNGPAYSFLMGRSHVTNAEFVTFLNDATTQLTTPRGEYLYFDSTNGDVFINTARVGQMGVGAGGRSIEIFSVGVSGRIEWVGGSYRLVVGTNDYTDHPVTGVSWYGAVKFCNWLTIDQGWPTTARCYEEDVESNIGGWRPRTIEGEGWTLRDLNDTERRDLVARHAGFRLPMDDGYGNIDLTVDSADAYNEWFKAAAWNGTLGRNTVFGFGRDALTAPDANFRCSGDPFEPASSCQNGGTTPVGFFDGSMKTVNGASFPTNPNANAFGLNDMTGNAYHWLQDRFSPSTSIDRRVLRGGGWNDPSNSLGLKCARRTVWALPETTSREIGFRVLRALPPGTGDPNDDGDIDSDDEARMAICHTGPNAPRLGGCGSFDFNADDDVDLLDWARFQRTFGFPP